MRVRSVVLFLALALIGQVANGAEPVAVSGVASPEQERFFEEKVRPILATSCLECHGAKKQESGLRLDSRQAMLTGGDSGEKAVVPGEPDRSLLVKAINYAGDIHMPPEAKLNAEQIDVLTDWVRQGLPWPASEGSPLPELSAADRAKPHRESHWAYRPVSLAPLPELLNPQVDLRNPIDAYVLARLESAGLTPSPAADARTLIRRVTYDLLGLPPTPEEVAAFVADTSPDAYERLVDRLLASPHFGERWGRHWLDVARYADTKGYAFDKDRRTPFSYTYRDYVIRAFNADLPYDQFVLQQLAADKLPTAEDKMTLAALGFLTTGRKFNDDNNDLDDKIDATTRGFLGLTVSCARCHDHKYDAIPTEDYYSLYGVFASCFEPGDLPLIAPPEQSAEYQKFEEEVGKLRADVDKFLTEKHAEYLEQSRKQAADYLARVAAGTQNSLLANLPFLSVNPQDLRHRAVERWQRYLNDRAKPEHATLGLWAELVKLPNESFSERSKPILESWAARADGGDAGQANLLVKAAFAADVPASRVDVARIYGKLLVEALGKWKEAGANEEALAKLPIESRQLAEVLVGKESPTNVEKTDTRTFLNRADRNKQNELQRKVDALQASSPVAPPRAMIVAERDRPVEPRVLIRGNPGRPGKQVPRQFLLVMGEAERQPFQQESGRLELAQKIVDPANPLTRRVIVNRLWMHHFGEPLVLTPSDFGIRCQPPSHPEMLDWLATQLLDSGWSLKSLHRQIVLSATYRQASIDRPECRAVDPENRLLWRANRRRLELEAMRDTLLAVSGKLDESLHGRAVELTKPPFAPRRAVYGYIDRQDLPNLFRVFDIASPDSSTPRRPRTTVPQQALFLMNSPLVVEQARAIAARLPQGDSIDDGQRLSTLYQQVLQREPTTIEDSISRQFLAAAQGETDAKLNAWEQLAQLLLLTNEVMYVD